MERMWWVVTIVFLVVAIVLMVFVRSHFVSNPMARLDPMSQQTLVTKLDRIKAMYEKATGRVHRKALENTARRLQDQVDPMPHHLVEWFDELDRQMVVVSFGD